MRMIQLEGWTWFKAARSWHASRRSMNRALTLRRTRKDLLRLDDRMLADIGLNRVEAWFEGDKPFWQD